MTIVTTSDFRANMTKYFDMASSGERVVVQSRRGDYSLKLVKSTNKQKAAKHKRDVTGEVCQALKDWKEYLETGKSDKFVTWEEMMDELRD